MSHRRADSQETLVLGERRDRSPPRPPALEEHLCARSPGVALKAECRLVWTRMRCENELHGIETVPFSTFFAEYMTMFTSGKQMQGIRTSRSRSRLRRGDDNESRRQQDAALQALLPSNGHAGASTALGSLLARESDVEAGGAWELSSSSAR
ncbi:unnamed protein product [Symbiodinium sp. CCMP2592]|nr:unnamed protein product [Symbiodinium sp. CCMP2592]